MNTTNPALWSSSDFPYQCLIDSRRTLAFRDAIARVVRPGDVVVDAGAGTGILSFFAVEAGAGRVLAVELDPALATCLEHSVRANGLADRVAVIRADAATAALPQHVDVFIGEILDTALMDEQLVPVVNQLRRRQVIGPATRLVPGRYDTYVEFGRADIDYYGYRIVVPMHRWPYLEQRADAWLPAHFEAVSPRLPVASADFGQPVDTAVDCRLELSVPAAAEVNALRLSGLALLAPERTLGATNAFNGDKVIPIDPVRLEPRRPRRVRLRYGLGAGLASLRVEFD